MRLEIYAELEPSRSGEEIIDRLGSLSAIYGRIDIPDIPLGKPSTSSPILGVYARERFRADVIVHLRVIDHNIVSLKSIIKTLTYVGVNKIILLRGDPPTQGTICTGHWAPEEAVTYAKGYGAEAGLLISPRKSDMEIIKRAQSHASAYYVTRLSHETQSRVERVLGLLSEVSPNSVLGLYVVVESERNRRYLQENNIPAIPLQELPRMLEWAETVGVERVILSTPGDSHLLMSERLIRLLDGWIKPGKV
ncbi:MAG: methylenetetrahydrofolate reductase [Desulfurococcales archaeon]|nr:methylenetetrahydrofolate reductase [Desulfurococcales archaeon]